jgi:polysaccharide export outer membrane protein
MISDPLSRPRKGGKKVGRDGARPSPFVIWEGWPPCRPILVFLFCALLQSFCERVSGQNIRSRGEIYGPTSSVDGQNIRSRDESYGPTSSVENTTSMEVLDDKRPPRVGDRLSMRVVEDRKPPTPLVVTDSGEVEVPLIGRVMAKGKTCKQFAYLIKGPLEREYYYKATVIIGLDVEGRISPGRVYVTGQVHNQGPIEIPPDETFTVSRAIIKAGGFADFANKKKVKLVRKNSSETIIVDVDTIVRKGRIDKDPVVEPEDTIIVPERLINF